MKLITCFIVSCFCITLLTHQQPDETVLPKDNLPATDLKAPLPKGLSENPRVPADNLLTEQKVALGRKLFFDPVLSEDGTRSCASCHQPDHGFASADPVAIGIHGRRGTRNAPSLLNKAYAPVLFWDGRVDSLEEQAVHPLSNPNELSSDIEIILEKLRNRQEYVSLFEQAFEIDGPSKAVTAKTIGQAIASFERTLLLGETHVDRFRDADYKSLNKKARQGLWIFESRGKCWKCHNGDTFSDHEFHNTGVGFELESRDLGRFEHTQKEEDKFKFRTPTLRGVQHSAPYMHDGSVSTLRDVVEFYNQGGAPDDKLLSEKIEPLNLSEADIDNLVEFLKALSN